MILGQEKWTMHEHHWDKRRGLCIIVINAGEECINVIGTEGMGHIIMNHWGRRNRAYNYKSLGQKKYGR